VLGTELPRRPARAQVAVTLGAGFSAGFYGLGALEPVIKAATGIDADFLIALGEAAAGRLGELPANVRSLDRWFPYGELFRTCAAVMHHGGGGSIMTAIDAGIPQMIVRSDGDPGGKIMGDAVQQRGLGISTTPGEVTPEQLHRLLTDDTFKRATAEVQAEVADLPTPATIAARLTELVG
jgi:UDP:flavonoid glycosyltransferase YjiC (YdhE family)